MKIARGVLPSASDGIEQIVFYDWGVGTGGTKDGITGGAFGWGLQRNVEDAYRFLVHNYQPGDQIFLFGFSRGAFTVRSIAGLMRQCSILKSKHAHLIKKGYDDYRDPEVKNDDPKRAEWRAKHSHPMPIIEFMGVFDTVGAMGVPANRFIGAVKFWGWGFWKGLRSGLKPGSGPPKTGTHRPSKRTKQFSKAKGRHGFHDMRLSRWVRNAYHALAIDELRPVFTPAIWDSELKKLPNAPAEESWDGVLETEKVGVTETRQSVIQSWFPGAHSDVGGNSQVHNSSKVLKWMATAAYQKSGLEFEKSFWKKTNEEAARRGDLSESPSKWWKPAGWAKRDMSGNRGDTECLSQEAVAREIDTGYNYEIDNRGHENLPVCAGVTDDVAKAVETAERIEAEEAARKAGEVDGADEVGA